MALGLPGEKCGLRIDGLGGEVCTVVRNGLHGYVLDADGRMPV